MFLIFPPYCLGRGMIDIAYNDYYNLFYAKTGQFDKILSPFEWEITKQKLVVMASVGAISWIVTLLIEYDVFKFKFFQNKRKIDFKQNSFDKKSEDCDVYSERIRVENDLSMSDTLVLRGLRKVYWKNANFFNFIYRKLFGKVKRREKLVAVENLSFGVPLGECFGLLGVNGAGKTTTFKMLTTDLEPSGGSIFAAGDSGFINGLTDIKKYWNLIGYCPQFDALYDELTPSDHLRLFARLKGIQSKYEQELCTSLLKRLDLTKYANYPVGTLSLGNKRKLSAAISLVANPAIVLLDEPTTGMDPVSRRKLWQEIINLIRTKKHSVLLTSHSMEECEVLCTRLVILNFVSCNKYPWPILISYYKV